jgi:replicative DNA helicase
MTMDYKYTDYHERWLDAVRRLEKLGKYALLIKLLDSADNIPYYATRMNKKNLAIMLWKAELVQKAAKKDWGKSEAFAQFRKTIQEIKRAEAIEPV